MKHYDTRFLYVIVWVLFTALVQAEVPPLINYQGMLTDAEGQPRLDGGDPAARQIRWRAAPADHAMVQSPSSSLNCCSMMPRMRQPRPEPSDEPLISHRSG